MTQDKAISALKIASYLSYFLGILTAALIGFAVSSDAQTGNLAGLNDIWNFGDSAIYLLCGFGLRKKSRFAAVAVLVLVLLNVSLEIAEGMLKSGGIIAMRIGTTYVFGRAVFAAYALNKIRRAEDPAYKGTRKWIIALISIPVVISIALFALGTAIEFGAAPTARVESGATLNPATKAELVNIGVLYPREIVREYYFYGFLSELAAGVLLTDLGVVYFENEGDDVYGVYAMDFEVIKSIEIFQEGDFWNDPIYHIQGFDDDMWLRVALSSEDDGDKRFVQAVGDAVENLPAD